MGRGTCLRCIGAVKTTIQVVDLEASTVGEVRAAIAAELGSLLVSFGVCHRLGAIAAIQQHLALCRCAKYSWCREASCSWQELAGQC